MTPTAHIPSKASAAHTGRRTLRRVHARALLFVLFTGAWWMGAHAQAGEADIVHRFTVAGIHTPQEAKPLQYAVMETGVATSFLFIPECACFKLSSVVPLGYEHLRALLAEFGAELDGPVELSTGPILVPPLQETHER